MTRRLFVLAACLFCAGAVIARADHQERPHLRRPLSELPLTLGPWHGQPEPAFAPEIVKVLGVDDYAIRSYRREATPSAVGVYIGYHAQQRHGSSIHSPLNCLPGAGWVPINTARIRIAIPTPSGAPPRIIEANRVEIEKGIDRNLVVYWYQSQGRVVASEYWGKVYTVVDAIRLNRTDAALVRIVVPIAPEADIAAAEATAVSFVQALFPSLGRYLPV